jgi:type I restriction enzyme, S subunit
VKVKPGYKRTEVGVIPEDWEVRAIGDIAEVKGGKRLPLGKSLSETKTPHPYIRVIDMNLGGVNLDNIKYVPEDVFPAIKNYRISSKDIFISVAGTLGIVGKIPSELDGANLTENADRITNIICDQDYLLYNLMSQRIQNSINSGKTVGAQPKLALGRIQNFMVAIPSGKTEQRAIAEVLSDVDALLDGLDRLIAKKRDLKQAAMQQLLTGQTRLPGFHGEWEVKRLGEISTIATGNTPPTNNASNYGDEFLFVSPVDMGDTKFITRTEKKLSKKGFAMSRRFPKGSILFVSIGSTIGKCGIAPIELTSNQQINAIFPSSAFSVDYLFYAVCSVAPRIKAQAGEQAVPIVNKTQFSETTVALPPLSEQTAIAVVLSDMDAELAALEQRRDKTRALKQAMMQELLTGKTRLVSPRGSHA